MACARPVTPHLQGRQASPGGDVAARAKSLALAVEDRRTRLARRFDGASGVRERIDHFTIKRVELFRAFERNARDWPFKCQLDKGAHESSPFSKRPIGAGRNSAAGVVLSDFETRNGNSLWASTSRSRSTPGAISITVTPSRSRRITQRS